MRTQRVSAALLTAAVAGVLAVARPIDLVAQEPEPGPQAPPFEIHPASLSAGEPVVVEMVFTAPAEGITPGGSIRLSLYLKPWNGLLRGLTEDRQGNTLVSASRSDGGPVDVVNVITNPQWAILSDLKLAVRDTPLAGGETLRVRFGDEAHPVRTPRKQANLVVEAEIDPSGEGQYRKLSHSQLRVDAGPPGTLHLRAPSYAVAGESVTLVVYAEDRSGNVVETYAGDLSLSWHSGDQEHHRDHRVVPPERNDGLTHSEIALTLEAPGVVYVEAEDRALGLKATSNPVKVLARRPQRNLYWGEIHVHSQLSDGRGELADVYQDGYARGLDFIAITDHSFGRPARGSLPERVAEVCEQADRFNRPGQYAAIPAGETHYLPQTHVNLYFAEADPEYIGALLNRLSQIGGGKLGKIDTPDERRAAGRRYWEAYSLPEDTPSVLAFPHHTMWTGIREFTDGERQRVIEVQSVHGSSETRDPQESPERLRLKPDRLEGDQQGKYSVREALGEGHRLGFVGGSDNHDGQPGKDAITAVYATALTRQAVLEAIHERSCYATSANRTLMEVTAGGVAMGQPVGSEGPVTLEGMVAGDGVLDRVEIICDGQVAHTCPERHQRVIEFQWRVPDPRPGYCYVRAILEDEGAAWSSPIRFDG